MIFKRKIYDELLRWKQTDNGKTAVLIQGARRVGKSTIAKTFIILSKPKAESITTKSTSLLPMAIK